MMFLSLWRAMVLFTATALGLTLLAMTISLVTWELSVRLFPWSLVTVSNILSTSLLNELLQWLHHMPTI